MDNLFRYTLDLSRIKDDEKVMDLLRSRFGSKDGSFDVDSRSIVPSPTLEILHYKENFVALAKRFDINLNAPKYFNSYHSFDEFTFKDDKSCLNAMHLSTLSIFKDVFVVTRTGVHFTWAGVNKYWYEVSQDVAKQLNIQFNCQEKKQ